MKCQVILCVIFLKISVSNTQDGGFLEDFFQKFPHLGRYAFAQVGSVQDPSSVFEDLIKPQQQVTTPKSVFEDLIKPQKRELKQPPSREVKSLPVRPVKRQLFHENTVTVGLPPPKSIPTVTTATIRSMFYKKLQNITIRIKLKLFKNKINTLSDQKIALYLKID